MSRRSRLVTAVAALVVLASPVAAAPVPGPAEGGLVNPLAEASNLLVSTQRPRVDAASGLMPQVALATAAYLRARGDIDPGRQPNPNVCSVPTVLTCPVDPRLADWSSLGGRVEPVLYTARTGATLSGHVWATRAGPARRPAVLLINGSIMGTEQMTWFAAQALARAGFVVLTFDAQGEGMSDQFGEAPDRLDGAFAGTPLLSLVQNGGLGGRGEPFYGGGQDSLDFLLSTPTARYEPAPSNRTPTSHADKQRRRVAAGLNASYNPLWELVDPDHIGVAGWSYGAIAASWLVQQDPRLDAAVAWDTLCEPVSPAPDEAVAILRAEANRAGGLFGLPRECFGAPPGPAPRITKPALGISADYLLAPQPYVVAPDPLAKSRASLAHSRADVDTGQIVIRGGTHVDFADLPGLHASARGIELVTWYTVAWFAKYLQSDPEADRMLLTTRWNADPDTARLDATRDGNVFSIHYRSRLDINRAAGGRWVCEDLRAGCAGRVPVREDCGPERFSFVAVDRAEVDFPDC